MIQAGRWSEVFRVFLKLGLTSFGGPIAHLGYFHAEFVERRRWIDERSYADLVALCQFLPGPASSQVGIAIGLYRAGFLGAFAAWAAFTLPSAIALILAAYGIMWTHGVLGSGWLHGLKVAAVAVVAMAVLGMARSLAPDRERATLAVASAGIALMVPSAWGQVAIILLGAAAGAILFRSEPIPDHVAMPAPLSRRWGLLFLAIFGILLVGLPLLAASTDNHAIDMIDAFYRSGSLIFGGGHVVLPLLQSEVVSPGWISSDVFLAGYGAAQAVPGPLTTFSAFLGAAMTPFPNGWSGAILCLLAIFAPSFLLVFGALPFWEHLRRHPFAQAALKGVNAVVVGLLLAAFYTPVWISGILNASDYAIGMAAFLLLFLWRAPPWLVVALCALAGGVTANM